MAREPKDQRELAARALCRRYGLPENTESEGKPMWMSFLPEIDAMLEAIERKPADIEPEDV